MTHHASQKPDHLALYATHVLKEAGQYIRDNQVPVSNETELLETFSIGGGQCFLIQPPSPDSFPDDFIFRANQLEPYLLGAYDCRWSMAHILQIDRVDLLQEVLDAGFPLQAPIALHHGSLLHLASAIGASKCIGLLIQQGLSTESCYGAFGDFTPIMEAARERQMACVLSLIEGGALWTYQDRYAQYLNFQEIYDADPAGAFLNLKTQIYEKRPMRPFRALGRLALGGLSDDSSGTELPDSEVLYRGVVLLAERLFDQGQSLEDIFGCPLEELDAQCLELYLPTSYLPGRLKSYAEQHILSQTLQDSSPSVSASAASKPSPRL